MNRLLTSETLKGIWATMLLPLNEDDSIDFACLKDQLNFITGAGVSGVYTNGTAGEFYNQTEDEYDLIQSLVAGICEKEGMLFQFGASHTSPVICIDRIKRTKIFQPCGYQVIFPDWLPLTIEEQIAFLKGVSEIADPVPLILYNPGHAKTTLQPKDFSILRQAIPALAGIKVAAKGPEWFDEMKMHSNGLSVFIQGHKLASGIKAGVANGSYSNIACLNPVGAVAWYQLMQDDIEAALIIEKIIAGFFEACVFPFVKAGYSDPALDKLLAFAGGWCDMSTSLRFPYKGISKDEALKVRYQAKKMLPQLITKF